MMRFCPNCQSERSLAEFFCEGEVDGASCGWDLSQVAVRPDGWRPEQRSDAEPTGGPTQAACPNGHPVEAGDLICSECGVDIEAETSDPQNELTQATEETMVAGWRLERQLPTTSAVRERYIAVNGDGREAQLTLYAEGSEPDSQVYDVLRTIARDHVPEIIEVGRWQDRAYEVAENVGQGTLADVGHLSNDIDVLTSIVREVGGALQALHECGLRHRDLRPSAILVRTREPLDIVISGFGSARLSEFDLDIVSPLETTRYTAPEAIAGGVAAASDWWSLGMLLLEQVTQGECFEGVNDQAFLIHVLTNGAPIPEGLDPRIDLLLNGLLTRDRHERWGWVQIEEWLEGGSPPVASSSAANEESAQRPLALGGRPLRSPARFALAAAQAAHWDEAKSLLLTGALATWADESGLRPEMQADIRRFARMDEVSEDIRLALTLKVLNPALPLTVRGEIVTPGWLLDHLGEGYALISGPVPDLLKDRDADFWLARLKARAEAVRERADQLGVRLEEDELRVHLLSTSRSRLAAIWADRRRLLPDTDHPGLISVLERRQTTDEDYILLLAASIGQFRTTEEILAEAGRAARDAGVETFDEREATDRLERPRRELITEVASRLEGFARCGIARVDEWADQFRLERRLPIDRTLALLAVPADQWREPPKQAYVATILDFFAKRVTGAVLRGPLTRLTIGKTTPRIDMAEIGTAVRPASAILDHLLLRNGQPIDIDPSAFGRLDGVERRLRTLYSHATLYRRDTGIDGLYLGFPFLLIQENKPGVVPRIAPVLLWPVKLMPEVGGRGRVTVAFDRDREEVRLNPAFEPLLGTDAATRWRAIAEELLSRATLNAADVMDAFAELARPDSRALSPLPNKDTKVTRGDDRLACAAAFFHLAYVGQAVMEDLKQLKSVPPSGTALETALRAGEPLARPPVERGPETDRYFTAASDPSQETAVLEARQRPGLLIEGPPGTGKSQTIVNIVADAIGRRRSLLIVCQKQAALEVVMKRLEAEGLGGRVLMINDVNKDRLPIIGAVRDQLEALFTRPHGIGGNWRQQREQTAARIEALEGDLDVYHAKLHECDERCGISYRLILSDLVGLEAGDRSAIDAPTLRPLLADLNVAQVASIEEACGPLARLWLPAKYEDSALAVLKPFGSDAGSLAVFQDDFGAFAAAERSRAEILVRTPQAYRIDDPVPHLEWVSAHANRFRALAAPARQLLARWLPLFDDTTGRELIGQLDAICTALLGLKPKASHKAEPLAEDLTDAGLAEWHDLAEELLTKPSFFGSLSPGRWLKSRRTKRFLVDNGMVASDLESFGAALRAELALRPQRTVAKAILERLAVPSNLSGQSPEAIAETLRLVRSDLQAVADLASIVAQHPNPRSLRAALTTGDAAVFEAFVVGTEQGCERYRARVKSLDALSRVSTWMVDDWQAARRQSISEDRAEIAAIELIEDALPTLAAYQRFRPRADQLDPLALAVFSVLRRLSALLEPIPERGLESEVRRIIRREARLAWKVRLEAESPVLMLDSAELEAKVEALAEVEKEMRTLNRRMLADGIDATRLRPMREWEDITRMRGQRARRLREFLDRGVDLGLMALRPVWLMNPDIASRVLPLRQGLFDAVIYDEASQMPVEYALPTLFRSGAMIVSGDEKQMPPTAFFASRVESDEADIVDADDLDAEASEAEREQVEETWNRREIKDCPDLLQLAKGVLPPTTLQIHYRSVYRELIQFSNAAFYSSRLSVPARHPATEIERVKPIEVVRADGIYENQTNQIEADHVVAKLAEFWRDPFDARPSIGVVTFNRKQADLIDEVIERKAERDPAFRAALAEERDRGENGEDMGFFVKNVENVQGDERDVIIFSSTFGRNRQGTFKRAFGVLGQRGGERRLNVAVTRARSKVVLITSMPIAEISDFIATRRTAAAPRDYLQAYFEYARSVSDGQLETAQTLLKRLSSDRPSGFVEERDHDGFQRSVAQFVRSLGWEPMPGGDEGAFGLDYAIVDPRTGMFGIGIECDAPRHPLLARARAREIWRPSVIRRSIPVIHRISSEAWYNDPQGERDFLAEAIRDALGQGSKSPPEGRLI